jgi:hypothetical protein
MKIVKAAEAARFPASRFAVLSNGQTRGLSEIRAALPAETQDRDVRLQVFTAVTIKTASFWDVAPCRSCVNRRFGGTYRLCLQEEDECRLLGCGTV